MSTQHEGINTIINNDTEDMATETGLYPKGFVPFLSDICHGDHMNAALQQACSDYENWLQDDQQRSNINLVGFILNVCVVVLGLFGNVLSFVVIYQGAFYGSMRVFFLSLAGKYLFKFR